MNRQKVRGIRDAHDGLATAVGVNMNGQPTMMKVFFVYSASAAAIASGSSGSAQFTVQADSDFIVQQLVGSVIVSNAVVANPYSTVQITDTGSSFNLFDTPQLFGNVFGTAQLPFILPVPKVLRANAAMNIAISNVNSAAAATYFMSFIGHRLYRAS